MKIGALWMKEKDGKKFMTGNIEFPGTRMQIAVFRNENKQGQQPDYEIVWSPEKKSAQREEFQDDVPF